MNRLPYHGAGILVWRKTAFGKTEVLLGLRMYDPQAGMWSIPGGGWDERKDGFEEGTTPDYRATAIRETWEEIRLSVEDPDLLTPLWRKDLPFYHFRVYGYPMTGTRDLVRHEEFSRLEWFPVDGLPKNTASFVRSQVSTLMKRHR